MVEMTSDQLKAAMKKGNKYKAVRTLMLGKWFASRYEADRYHSLVMLEKGRVIFDLRTQVTYRLKVNGVLVTSYRADFVYRRCNAPHAPPVVEDAKGFKTPLYKLKKKLMVALYGISIVEV